MKTLDIRISQSKRDLRRSRETFSNENNVKVNTQESYDSEKADGEFQFSVSKHSSYKKNADKENIDVLGKANIQGVPQCCCLLCFVHFSACKAPRVKKKYSAMVPHQF